MDKAKTHSLLVFADQQHQIDMLAQRYALVYQRILRHDLFRSSDLHRSNASGTLKITPIESLLGKKGGAESSSAHLVLLLGILLQIEEGVYYLEDPTGQVPVSFQQAIVTDASYVTEHSILLVEGHFQDGLLYVHRAGQPLQESRTAAIRSIQQQVSHPDYALPKSIAASDDDIDDDSTFVILQDLYMDQPRVLQQLEGLFATYENYSVDELPLFVLMGSFCSPHLVSTAQPAALHQLVKSAIDELLAMVSTFPNLAAHAHFCIVPSPNDTLCRVLPFPPLSKVQPNNGKVAHLNFASNPCRIRWNGKEMVIFRYDLLHLLQMHQIRLPSVIPEGDNEDGAALRAPLCRLLKTVLDQGNLVPVAGVPVYWNYSHALALYPLPNCLVVSGDGGAAHENYWDCDVIQTASFSKHSSYAVYRPGAGADDDSMNSEGARAVELCTLGDDIGAAE